MNLITLMAQSAVNDAMQTVEKATQTDIIGIGGILATIIVGIITCFVTWFVTMRTIKQLKISYSIKSYPILSNAININNRSQVDGFQILYRNKLLENPCMLAVDIENIGNKSIQNPPIRISSEEEIQIIPGYFENIPNGYEGIWKIESDSQDSCKLLLQHINPKQTVHTRFYLNKQPQKDFRFECPMADLQLQKSNRNIEVQTPLIMSRNPYVTINITLIAIIVLLFITMDTWNELLGELIYRYTNAHVQPIMVIIYILAVLIIALVINLCKPRTTTSLINRYKAIMGLISLSMILISFALLYLIVYNILIVSSTSQVITAIIALILLSLSIHILTMIRSH